MREGSRLFNSAHYFQTFFKVNFRFFSSPTSLYLRQHTTPTTSDQIPHHLFRSHRPQVCTPLYTLAPLERNPSVGLRFAGASPRLQLCVREARAPTQAPFPRLRARYPHARASHSVRTHTTRARQDPLPTHLEPSITQPNPAVVSVPRLSPRPRQNPSAQPAHPGAQAISCVHPPSHTITHDPTRSHTIPHDPTRSHTIPHDPTRSHTSSS